MELTDKNRRQFVRICMIIAAICLTSVLLAACAGFDKVHSDEFITCGRSFRVTGEPAGVFAVPGGRPTGAYEPGEVLLIDFYYTDKNGGIWGSVGGGWVGMERLELVYDYIAFGEQHSDQISDATEPLPEGPRYLWTYPRSGEIIGIDTSPDEEISLSSSYTDDEGLVWVYFCALNNSGWVCLDAPYDNSIPAADYGPAEMHYIKPPEKPGYWDRAPSYAPYAWGVIVLVILVEAALQLRSHIKKNRK